MPAMLRSWRYARIMLINVKRRVRTSKIMFASIDCVAWGVLFRLCANKAEVKLGWVVQFLRNNCETGTIFGEIGVGKEIEFGVYSDKGRAGLSLFPLLAVVLAL
jgi:hypothetical protein